MRIPKKIIGARLLKWGYLACLVREEGGDIIDFLSPADNKGLLLSRLRAISEGKEDTIQPVLPMMRLGTN